MVKNPPANAGDTGDTSSIPGLRRSPGEGNGSPLQYSCLEHSIDRGAWWATYSPWGYKELDMTEWLTHRPKFRGIWQATVHGVTKMLESIGLSTAQLARVNKNWTSMTLHMSTTKHFFLEGKLCPEALIVKPGLKQTLFPTQSSQVWPQRSRVLVCGWWEFCRVSKGPGLLTQTQETRNQHRDEELTWTGKQNPEAKAPSHRRLNWHHKAATCPKRHTAARAAVGQQVRYFFCDIIASTLSFLVMEGI